MYLELLNHEQKKMFLGLASKLALADGVFDDKEKGLIEAYRKEMHLDFEQEISEKSSEEIIDKLSITCGDREKKIMVFELVGLAMVDGHYHISERELINMIIDKFNLNSRFGDKCEEIIGEYLAFQSRINKLILE